MSRTKQRKLFVDLLALLRNELQKPQPIHFASISGDLNNNKEVLQSVVTGIISPGDHYFTWQLPGAINLIFGGGNYLLPGLVALQRVAPKINEAVRSLITRGPLNSIDHFNEDQCAVFACEMIWIYAEDMRVREPESLSFPVVFAGNIEYNAGPPPSLFFPNGRTISSSDYPFLLWNEAKEILSKNNVEIRIIQTPVLQTAALVARFISEAMGYGGRKAAEKSRVASLRRLSQLQRTVYAVIKHAPDGETISGKQIVKTLQNEHGIVTSEPTLTSHIIPKLKKLGVRSRKKGGYWVDPPVS